MFHREAVRRSGEAGSAGAPPSVVGLGAVEERARCKEPEEKHTRWQQHTQESRATSHTRRSDALSSHARVGIRDHRLSSSDPFEMNPPPPPSDPRSTALVAIGAPSAALSRPSAVPSSAPYASAPWSPATRGWLVPSAAQQANATTADERTKALALATNRAANAVQLHKASDATFVAAPRRDPKVLDEDTYLADMNSIIRRDFFPALDAMEAKLALHTPSWNGRMTGASTDARRGEAKRRKGIGGAVLTTPGATPHTAAALQLRPLAPQQRAEGASSSFEDETPVPHARFDSPSRLEQPGSAAASSSAAAAAASSSAVIPHVSAAAAAAAAAEEVAATRLHPTDLRLGSYLELHTSADNASFTDLQRKRVKQVDARMHWANKEFEQKANDQRIVLADDPTRSGNVSGWKYEVKNRLFYYPDHKGMSERHTDAYDASLTPAQQVADALAQKSASIEYENTRFPGPLTNPFPGQHASSNPQVSPASSVTASTPSVGGYKLLRTPVVAPGGVGAESPLVTWGQLLATPAHLREEDAEGVGPLQLGPEIAPAAAASGSSSGFGFKIAATPHRDEIAWGLSEAARKKEAQEKKRKRADATPVPLSMGLFAAATPVQAGMMRPPLAPASAAAARSRRAGATPSPAVASAASTPMLSPAAQRLLKATVTSAAGRRSSRPSPSSSALGGLDAQLRASYSPSPAALAHGTR